MHALTRFRERYGLSLKEFGDRVGVTPAAVWRWEASVRFPRPQTLRRIRLISQGELTATDFVDPASSNIPEGVISSSPFHTAVTASDDQIDLTGSLP